jgi:hypothetical protein
LKIQADVIRNKEHFMPRKLNAYTDCLYLIKTQEEKRRKNRISGEEKKLGTGVKATRLLVK